MDEVSRIIAEEIREKGPIPFARFMELALYCPVCGYYERDADSVGRHGDFQTSVSVGRAFGELLAFQFSLWLDQLNMKSRARRSVALPACPSSGVRTNQKARGKLQLVEAGAHDGRLAQDILDWIKANRSDLWQQLDYIILEPSHFRLQKQRQLLEDYSNQLHWCADFTELFTAVGSVQGVIFCNELLDAMPVQRFGWDRGAGAWFEWCVDKYNDQFIWSRGEWVRDGDQAEAMDWVPAELLASLPDGYVVETSPAAVEWWRSAANALGRGWLMTCDYGFDEMSALMPERTTGTLRSYRGHQIGHDILRKPGDQDITAHVHFGLIQKTGESAGLQTDYFGEQGRYLTRVFGAMLEGGTATASPSPEWIRQFKTLVHPDHFGRSFQVLVQGRV